MSNDFAAAAPLAVPSSPGLNQVERVVDTFVAPSKTFTDILRSSSWWLPFILLVLSSLASAFVVDRQVGFDRVYENQLHLSPKAEARMADSSPQQREQIMKVSAAWTKYITYATSIFVLVFIAIYALILWASFNFGLGAKTTYPQVFAVAIYSALPYLVTVVLTILTLYFGGNAEAYDYKDPVGTNLGYYLTDTAPWLKALLGSLDIVKLWADVLTVIGMAIISKKTIMQSAVIVGILWVIGVLFTVVGAAFS